MLLKDQKEERKGKKKKEERRVGHILLSTTGTENC